MVRGCGAFFRGAGLAQRFKLWGYVHTKFYMCKVFTFIVWRDMGFCTGCGVTV